MQPGHLCLCCVAPLLCVRETHGGSCVASPYNQETVGASHQGAGYDYIPSPCHDIVIRHVGESEHIPEHVYGGVVLGGHGRYRGRYVGPIPTTKIPELVSVRRDEGSRGGGGGSRRKGRGAVWSGTRAVTGGSVGATRVHVCYEEHLLNFYLRDKENLHNILVGALLPTVQGHVICNNWHL